MKYVWSTFRQNNVWQTFSTQLKWAKRPNWMKFSGQLSLSKDLISQSSVSIWPNEKTKRKCWKCWMLIEVENGAMHHSPPCTHLLNLFQINNIVLGWCSLLWFLRPCLILQNSSPRTQRKNPKPETLCESCQFLSF